MLPWSPLPLPSRTSAVVALAIYGVVSSAGPSGAIVIRHDRSDAAYVAAGERYASVLGHLEERAESVLVAPRWVLTVAHNVQSSGPFDAPYVLFGEERYEVEKVIVHPEWEGGWPDLTRSHDLALLKLASPVEDAEPVALYPFTDELGKIVTVAGRGKTGTGLTGAVGEKGTVVRGATQEVEGASDTVLLTVFDDPERDATELEGQGGPGDSGGPAFLDLDGRLYLAGVGSFGTGRGAYGTVDGWIRVSAFRLWIEDVISTDPPPRHEWTTPSRGPLPDTPVGRAARALVEALESGRLEDLVEYHRRFGNPGQRGAEAMGETIHAQIVESYGPIRLHGWSVAGPSVLRFLFYSERQETWRSLHLEVEGAGDGGPELTRLFMKWESPPKPEVWP